MEIEERLTGSSEFGNLLRRLRLAAGLSQEALAERARMSSDGISALERGHRRSPQRETLALLAGALALTDQQRQEFETAALRSSSPRRVASVTVGPWPDTAAVDLPLSLNSFVGRDNDLAEIASLVREHRLVTLTGTGGVGKTQTALRVALSDDVAVRFVGFAPIGDPNLVVAGIAAALGVQEVPSSPLLETISAYLRNRTMLLVLDNCEHLIAEVANVAGKLLSGCPRLRMLVTSREPIRAAGEYAYRLSSLDSSSAVALFSDRARAADHHFALTDENVPFVAEICQRLDGIPLAIELAAARVNVLSIPTLAQRLNERFKILTSGERTAVPRQQTMHATIDWSYDLLSPQEQLLLARLGVFSGSFSLDAAVAVCGEGLDENGVFDVLTSLTDKSLVVADIGGAVERYRLLESTVAYALEKLVAPGERERLTQRQAEYFRDHAAAADERFGPGSTVAWVAGVELELDNYRAALEWALRQGNNAVLGGALAGTLQRLWYNAGLTVEGRYWIELALSLVRETEQPAIAARLQFTLSAFFDGKRCCEAAQRAIQLYESVGDRRGAARAQRQRGWALFQMGQLEAAREASAQALAVSQACEDAWNVANCQNLLAALEWELGDFDAGRELFAQALASKKALGDELETAETLSDMAELEFGAGNPEQALHLHNEALEIDLRGKNAGNIAFRYINGAAYRIALDDPEGARDSAREGLLFARQVQAKAQAAVSLQRLALLAALGGDPRRGAQLLGYVEAQYNELGMRRESTERWCDDKLHAALRESLSDAEIDRLAAEGAAWSEDEAVEEALQV